MKRIEAETRLAAIILSYPHRWKFYGYPLSKASHVRPGKMYPTLRRWHEAGYLTDGWDDDEPPRRYYVLTEQGRARLEAM